MIPPKKVLLFYKKSAYSIYFLERKTRLIEGRTGALRKEIARFKKAHDEHHRTLERLEQILKSCRVGYVKRFRGQPIGYARYDTVIAVGGDGTFLEAARHLGKQLIIGINSAPSFSVGKLCAGHPGNLERLIRGLAAGRLTPVRWPRLRLKLDGHKTPVDSLNDVLVCHANPAAMTRYYLQVGKIREEQRNSGLWVSSAAGSSGAIKSAGGKVLKPTLRKIQYRPRELYKGFSSHYCLKGGVLTKTGGIRVTSLMRQGVIFVDGTHFRLAFPFNATLKVSFSPNPIRTVRL